MKLKPETFMAWWPVLCERWSREPSTALAALYFDSLSQRMGDAEFQVAASRLVQSGRYFPSPEEFLQAVQPDLRAEALREWRKVLTLLERGPGSGLGVGRSMNAAAHAALDSLGGWKALGQTSPEEVMRWTRRDFLDAYEAEARDQRQLALPQLPTPTPGERKLLQQHVPNLLGGSEHDDT